MTQAIEATNQNGVFVPTEKPDLAEHERVRLTIETIPPVAENEALAIIRARRANRLEIDEFLAREIADDPNMDILKSP